MLHPQGRIDVEVSVEGIGADARIQRAALVRTARKILQGELHIPSYVFSKSTEGDKPVKRLIAPAVAAVMAATAPLAMAYPDKTITIVVPTAAGGGNDAMARTIAQKLGAAARADGDHRQPRRRQRRDRERIRRPRRA